MNWKGLAAGSVVLLPNPPYPLPSGTLTLILWKFTLQLAPALEGMKRSPCLLGEDTGELAGVRVRRISATWRDGKEWVGASDLPREHAKAGLPHLACCTWPLAVEQGVQSWKPEEER